MTYLEETKLLSSFVMTIMSNDSSYDCLFIALPSLRSLVLLLLLFFVVLRVNWRLTTSAAIYQRCYGSRTVKSLSVDEVRALCKQLEQRFSMAKNPSDQCPIGLHAKKSLSNIRSSTIDSFGKDGSSVRSRCEREWKKSNVH